MPDVTTRAGFVKPLGTEPRSITPINGNMDKADKWLGCFLVNDGVLPSAGDSLDGMIVRERTSGIIYEYRKNSGTGLFEKKYIQYPFRHEATRTWTAAMANDQTFRDYWLDTDVTSRSVNAAALGGSGYIVVPIKGLYTITLRVAFASNASGHRGIAIGVNQSTQLLLQNVIPGFSLSGFGSPVRSSGDYLLQAGDQLNPRAWQDSGTTLTNTIFGMSTTLIQPLN